MLTAMTSEATRAPETENEEQRGDDLADVHPVRDPRRQVQRRDRRLHPGDPVEDLVDAVKEDERRERQPEDQLPDILHNEEATLPTFGGQFTGGGTDRRRAPVRRK